MVKVLEDVVFKGRREVLCGGGERETVADGNKRIAVDVPPVVQGVPGEQMTNMVV